MLETGQTFMIDGFPVKEVSPAPWHLALIWKHGRVTIWPAASMAEAIALQDKISLRPDLMQRIEVRGLIGFPLWDADWPQDRPADVLAMPYELNNRQRLALLHMMQTRKL